MSCKCINMETYKRRAHFDYFCGLAYPYVGLTVNVEITGLLAKVKVEGLPFFLTVCYCVSRAANSVAEFRQRIVDGKIMEFGHCPTSHTVALADETYCYCSLHADMPFAQYIPYALREQGKARQQGGIGETAEEALDKLFISTLPWLSYTSLIQPTPFPADSNPRITWGKYFRQGDQTLLPLSVLCHHALVDGLHIARFYQALEKEMACICEQ